MKKPVFAIQWLKNLSQVPVTSDPQDKEAYEYSNDLLEYIKILEEKAFRLDTLED